MAVVLSGPSELSRGIAAADALAEQGLCVTLVVCVGLDGSGPELRSWVADRVDAGVSVAWRAGDALEPRVMLVSPNAVVRGASSLTEPEAGWAAWVAASLE